MQPVVVAPMDIVQGGVLDIIQTSPRTLMTDQFRKTDQHRRWEHPSGGQVVPVPRA